MRLALLTVVAALTVGAQPSALQGQASDDPVQTLVMRLESVARRGVPDDYYALLSERADRSRARAFATTEIRPGVTRVVVRERDRLPLKSNAAGATLRLQIDAMMEFGDRARVTTWRVDIVPDRQSSQGWRVFDQERITSIEDIYRLSVNSSRQYDARNFSIRAEDFELALERGSVFTVDIDRGVTGLVLLGDGVMRFQPKPAAERGQVKILAGSERLEARFDTAFVRVGDFDARADRGALRERAVDTRELRRAEEVFKEESGQAYVVGLADLSADDWWMLPARTDVVAEVRTRRYGTLTYTYSDSLMEDVSLFHRTRQRPIATYMSPEKLATSGRTYSDHDLARYEVLDYDLDLTVAPTRRHLEGRATLRIRMRTPASQLPLRLHEAYTVRSVVSDRFGRLFSLRVKGENLLLVNLPALVLTDTDFAVTITYAGRVTPQTPQAEMSQTAQDDILSDELRDPPLLLSNRSDWYPHNGSTDYATARIRVTLPAAFEALASGARGTDESRPGPLGPDGGAERSRPGPSGPGGSDSQKTIVFAATRPLRYLSLLVGRLAPVARRSLTLADRSDPFALDVFATRLQVSQSQTLADRAADIVRFYHSLIGDVPYPSLALAAISGLLPAGHSPGHLAVLAQPSPHSQRTWRNDPAAFDNRPDFFLAHEIAHQWWGQAVGWRNYHEQWLSEGFAQYFAALYVRHRRGDADFDAVMRQMRRWALEESEQGPISLGYRLGSIQNDGRVFRALVYNKAAVVLDMLRLLMGDDAFFAGLRRFYERSRFATVGTHEFRQHMEPAAGRSLERFFDGWVYGTSVPALTVTQRVESSPAGAQIVVRAEQSGVPLDVPVVATVRYANRPALEFVMRLTDSTAEHRLDAGAAVRSIEFEKHANLATIIRD
jgi:hypothetical protein